MLIIYLKLYILKLIHSLQIKKYYKKLFKFKFITKIINLIYLLDYSTIYNAVLNVRNRRVEEHLLVKMRKIFPMLPRVLVTEMTTRMTIGVVIRMATEMIIRAVTKMTIKIAGLGKELPKGETVTLMIEIIPVLPLVMFPQIRTAAITVAVASQFPMKMIGMRRMMIGSKLRLGRTDETSSNPQSKIQNPKSKIITNSHAKIAELL